MKAEQIRTRVRIGSWLAAVVLLSLIPFLSYGAPAPGEYVLTGADRGRQIELDSGQVLAIRLEGNPSTGYTWEVAEMDPAILREVGQVEFEPQSGLMGAPAWLTRRFVSLAAGRTDLVLVYRRPWEDAEPLNSFSVAVETAGAFDGAPVPDRSPQAPQAAPAAEPLALPDEGSAPNLPTAFNWCDQMYGCTPVKNQGACGSCWAFATVGPLELLIKLEDGATRDLSEQYLLSCNTDGYDCDGGWWVHDYHEWKIPPGEPDAGAVYEADFPYVASDVACNPPHTHHEKIDDWAYVDPYDDIPSVTEIKEAIYEYGPVAVGLCVGPAFHDYDGGVFTTDETYSCGGGINHAVVLVGWDDSQGIWHLRNSWGSGWGEGGYMRITRGISNVGYGATYVEYEGLLAPTAPSGLTATPLSQSQIGLSWSDNSINEDGFQIERSPDGYSGWGQIGTVGANVTAYTNSGLSSETAYWYRVRAYNTAGESTYSNVAQATTFGELDYAVYLPRAVKDASSAGGFDSQFNGSAEGWVSHSGTWYYDSSYLYTYGLADSSASASYTADFSDFDYAARLWREGCDSCATRLYVRGTPLPLSSSNNWYSQYLFQYTRDRYYSIYKIVAGGSAVALQGWTLSPAINQGDAWNLLRVVASGTSLSFYINGTPVWTGFDASLSSGRVGVGMYRDAASSDNGLWVDWATLTPLARADVEAATVSAEQQALNDAANRRGGGDENRAPH